MINYENIRNMNLDQMAKILAKIQIDTIKGVFKDLEFQDLEFEKTTVEAQYDLVKQWLLQEVEE